MKRFFLTVWQREGSIYFVLCLLVLLLRIPTLGQPFENDSAAIAYHARLITQGFPLYGTHHPAHHMPGAYYLYAIAFFLMGDRVQSVRIALLIWTGLSVILIYRLGKLVFGKEVGFIAGLNSAVMLSHMFLAGTNTKIESFVILPQVTAVYTLMLIAKKPSPTWKYFFPGFFSFAVFFFKANYVSPILLTGILIFKEILPQWKSLDSWKLALRRTGWAILGFCLPTLLMVVYFVSNGILDRFLQLFVLGFSYTQVVHDASPLYIFFYPQAVFGKSNLFLLVTGTAGALIFFLSLRKKSAANQNLGNQAKPELIAYLIFWFCFSFIETGISRTFLHNYYLMIVPPLALLSAWFLVKVANDVGRTLTRLPVSFPHMLLILMTILSLLWGSASNSKYLYHYYTKFLPGEENYRTVLKEGLPAGVAETMEALDEIGQYVNSHTETDDTIYYWSNFMELYYLADRRSSADIIWPLYIDAFGQRNKIFEAEFILLGDTPLGYQEVPEWLKQGLASEYQLEVILYDQKIYRRIH